MRQRGIQILSFKEFPWLWIIIAFVLFLFTVNQCQGQNNNWFNSEPESLEVTTRSEVIRIAQSLVGIKEATGNNDGPMIEVFLASAGLKGNYAWCAAAVNWIFQQACAMWPESLQAWSPSWFPAERTYWQLGVSEYYQPQPGDVFGIYFPSKDRIAHLGIIESYHKYASTLEGNTNEAGSREGDGYWRKKRLKKQISKVSNWIDN